jgi:hypothetical protein
MARAAGRGRPPGLPAGQRSVAALPDLPFRVEPSSPDADVEPLAAHSLDWQLHHPPSSVPSDITLSQFLTIQEKGVSAWSFEPDYESNMAVYVQGRTEITFLDGPGMPAAEGGGNSVLANLPLPKLNEVYYFECKMYEKPDGTDVAVGLATKPYPNFRLPGASRLLLPGFHSASELIVMRCSDRPRPRPALGRVRLRWLPDAQLPVHRPFVRPTAARGRRPRCRLPAADRNRLLHAQRP